jgi:hypothetical protein
VVGGEGDAGLAELDDGVLDHLGHGRCRVDFGDCC